MYLSATSKMSLLFLLLALAYVLGCEVVNDNSAADLSEIRSMLKPYNITKRLHTNEEYGWAEAEMESLADRLNLFCKSHNVSRTVVLDATNVSPILNDRDSVIIVFHEYSCAMSGVVFVFSGGVFVKEVRPFTAMR